MQEEEDAMEGEMGSTCGKEQTPPPTPGLDLDEMCILKKSPRMGMRDAEGEPGKAKQQSESNPPIEQGDFKAQRRSKLTDDPNLGGDKTVSKSSAVLE